MFDHAGLLAHTALVPRKAAPTSAGPARGIIERQVTCPHQGEQIPLGEAAHLRLVSCRLSVRYCSQQNMGLVKIAHVQSVAANIVQVEGEMIPVPHRCQASTRIEAKVGKRLDTKCCEMVPYSFVTTNWALVPCLR